jgi:hypothetical protein
MWKRDESVKPAPPPAPAPAAPAAPAVSMPAASSERRTQTLQGENVNIGKSVVIKGELSGSEDLTIEGNVEGRIELKENILTIGPNGKIRAEVFAKSVIVLGEVRGSVDMQRAGAKAAAPAPKPANATATAQPQKVGA